jgi:hypothetical protein
MAEAHEGPGGAAPARERPKAKEVVVEEKIDPVLHVDRTIHPVYPEWMKPPLHPELELTGPAEYDLKTNMDISFIAGQGNGTFTGLDAYEHLKSNNLLDGCLGLADGYAIRERGAKAFSKFFEAKESAAVTLWTAVFMDDDGKLYAPIAIPINGKVVISRGDLSILWTKYRPLVRFQS